MTNPPHSIDCVCDRCETRAEYEDAVGALVNAVSKIYDPAMPVAVAADRVTRLRAKLGIKP